MVPFVHPLRDHELKLGRSAPSAPPLIKLREFVDVEKAKSVIQALPLVDYSTLIKVWQMFLNDQIGDCVCAGAAHARMVWGAMVGQAVNITDLMVQTMYEQSGYRPGQPNTDQGWTLQAAAGWLRATGFFGTPDVTAYAQVGLDDADAQQVAGELFGGLYEGVSLPTSAQTQYQAGWIWRETNKGEDAGGWGGHCMYRPKNLIVLGHSARGRSTHVTWGGLQVSTWDWDKAYIDELMVFVPANWEQEMPPAIVEAGVVDFGTLSNLVTQYTT
jgi:hypothetical protein